MARTLVSTVNNGDGSYTFHWSVPILNADGTPVLDSAGKPVVVTDSPAVPGSAPETYVLTSLKADLTAFTAQLASIVADRQAGIDALQALVTAAENA
jgi:hypothetical protein